jgi:hypothetical protein
MTIRWPSVEGARVTLPQDLERAYLLGRFGATTAYDCAWAAFGSTRSARRGLSRLALLGIARTFPRPDLTTPAWYSLSPGGLEWVVEVMGCPPDDLRRLTGLKRTNIRALAARNRLWSSIVAACRKRDGATLALARPEWELRRMKTILEPVVPDFLFVLSQKDGEGERLLVWMVEQDSGTERSTEWRKKAVAYASVRGRVPLFGAREFFVLAVVPSVRRAITVATAVCESGAGGFVFVALPDALERGRALDPGTLWKASELVTDTATVRRYSLLLLTPNPGQRPRPAAGRGEIGLSGGMP